MNKKIWHSIKTIWGYTIGYTIINCAIPNIGIKEFCLVTLGGVVLICTAILSINKK